MANLVTVVNQVYLNTVHPSCNIFRHAAARRMTVSDLCVGVVHVVIVIDDRVEARPSGIVPRKVLVGSLHIERAV